MSTGLIWFQNNLRIEDNLALAEACKENDKVIAIYFFDPRQFDFTEFGLKKTGKFRAKFLIETVTELKENLASLNIPLFIYQEKPEDYLPKFLQEYNISNVYLQKEWTSEEQKIISKVKREVSEAIQFKAFYDQFLFHPEDIPYSNFNKIPKVFTEFRKKCEAKVSVRKCSPTPQPLNTENFDLKNNTKIPNLKDLGFEEFAQDSRTAFPFKGGENQAKKRVQQYFWETRNLAKYKQTRNGLIGEAYSSKLSAWLANGSISAKQVYWEVKKFEKEITKNQDTYWLIFELIWRDYFKFISLKHGNKIFKISGILEKELDWNKDEKARENWINGETKEPFVNANMKELAATGFMSNRGRQNVASYWAKELKQDWRVGAAYFESLLIDYDVHSNWGNWMYNSGVGNDPRDRKFNIKRQAEHYDPDQKFQNLWLKE
ncbi:DASH family cryptochrome [Salegentibacter mishustinae]|uniref:Cryptochrome DASH n=1 Tax=Salegentibacter mishustinae TaxID=270918 RepID=A0A0Q9ZBK0_9FLAO|nr:DASH family cryptochrome [Salegentibacter mishustinae]KRG30416.1 deoxyribodipyrimidine photolyase [Salegentibacter mishustinae]PNW23310.1 deoxyribodipyrimidine photolyase [Salegentibacter mishustinae]PZX66373.1 deoxyribodipyrimidine photo-lyase (single-stranded DNA-specific) [Salegentibacter mishustinae]GGW82138.1 deoxyribodipyrimidine photo-lyase [Salegentibacter mishustinae]